MASTTASYLKGITDRFERDQALALISKITLFYARADDAQTSAAKGLVYYEYLSRFPLFAINAAVDDWMNGNAVGDHNYDFPPMPAALVASAERAVRSTRDDYALLLNLIEALQTEPEKPLERTPEMIARVKAQHAMFERTHEEQNRQEKTKRDARKREIDARAAETNRRFLDRELEAAGLPKGGNASPSLVRALHGRDRKGWPMEALYGGAFGGGMTDDRLKTAGESSPEIKPGDEIALSE